MEMHEKAMEEERERNRRYFESTTKTTYHAKPFDQNTVGRRVMQT